MRLTESVTTYKSKQPYINKAFEASTGHITKKDDTLLKDPLSPIAVYSYEFGYFIYVSEDEEDLKDHGFSAAFIKLISLARGKKCKYLQLDCDGVEYEDLPTFDW